MSGNSLLESHLHRNLVEHVASEVALGTIVNAESAKKWLLNSFLYQRMQRNPTHYSGLNDKSTGATWQDRLNNIVEETLSALDGAGLISRDNEGAQLNDRCPLTITEIGEIMTKVGNEYPYLLLGTRLDRFETSSIISVFRRSVAVEGCIVCVSIFFIDARNPRTT